MTAPLANVVLADEQRKLKEEQDIADLMALEADIDARRKEQLMSGALGVGQAVAVAAVAAGDLLADLEFLRDPNDGNKALDDSDTKELGGLFGFFSKIGGS